MEANIFLSPSTSAQIDRRVQKILHDLGASEPPIRLEHVRDLLSLDLRYYSTANTSFLEEAKHRVFVAGKQVFRRPRLLLEAVKKASLKALYIHDQKRILIDEDLPAAKQRWSEAHEILHSIIPWHDALAHGDNKQTLTRSCHAQIEAEANFGAGHLLFMQSTFEARLKDVDELGIGPVKDLAKEFGNTITSTLWRTVESLEIPAFAIISSGHPLKDRKNESGRYFVCSKEFKGHFSRVSAPPILRFIQQYSRAGGGTIGQGELTLTNDYGNELVFYLESFFNTYETLTLGYYLRPSRRKWGIA